MRLLTIGGSADREPITQARVFALPLHPADANFWIGRVQEAARAKRLQLPIVKARNDRPFEDPRRRRAA